MRSPSRHDAGVADVLVAELAAQVGCRRSSRLVVAPSCPPASRKCTPPRRSRPRYIGRACRLVSHFGDADSRFSATTYWRVFGSGLKVDQYILGLAAAGRSSAAGPDAVAVEEDAAMLDARRSSGCSRPEQGASVSTFDRRLDAGDLHGRRFAEEVRQGVDEAEHHCQRDDDVFPEGYRFMPVLEAREGGRSEGAAPRQCIPDSERGAFGRTSAMAGFWTETSTPSASSTLTKFRRPSRRGRQCRRR